MMPNVFSLVTMNVVTAITFGAISDGQFSIIIIIIPPASKKLKVVYTGFTSSVCRSIAMLEDRGYVQKKL